ncbi:hypothetical protein O3G_MSEX008261 [Manduca sexta]|uniref:Cytochrome c oxidase polypeptide VIa n=1 Tax=Manduca sexta TaxID=7130 RepID=A0A922CPM8_MANSE|nr:hypothetical protein O3G_MSEX008261 [Manduca sexta]
MSIKILSIRPVLKVVGRNDGGQHYSLCCPPRHPPGQSDCPPQVPGGGRKIVPPADCRPGPIPPNPCVPRFHHGKDTWKKYRNLTFFLFFPLIIIQAFYAFNHEVPSKTECRDYEYMRIRTKRFPWGDGIKTFFHNDRVNHLPGDCELPPLDCD